MKLFRKQKRKQRELPPFLIRQLLYLNNKLHVFAAWLQQKTNGVSSKKIKILFLVFCLIFLSVSIIVMYQSFKKDNTNLHFISPIPIMPLLKEQRIRPVINEREFKRIHSYKVYLDSLQKTTKGKLKFDSLLSMRPHLTDTINYLENLYYDCLLYTSPSPRDRQKS